VDVGHRRRPAGLQRDGLRVGEGALHQRHVLRRNDRPALDAAVLLVVDEADLDGVAADLERVDADDRAGEALAHVGVHPLNDRDDRDQERHRDDDAEQREERA